MSAPTTDQPSPEVTALARRWNLEPLRGRPRFGAYLAQMWQRRAFMLELARSRFRAQNEADRLGSAWIILLPLLNALVYGTIFRYLIPSKLPNFVPYLVIGVFMFQFFGSSFQNGARVIHANKGLVTSLHFPRAVLPLAAVLQEMFALLWSVAAMLGILLLLGEWPQVSWLLLPPIVAVYAVFNAGIALIAARATAKLRDIAQLVPFITRVFFYISGIFYHHTSTSGSRNPMGLLMEYNPVANFLTLCRVSLLGRAHIVSNDWNLLHQFGIAALWAVVLFVAGFVWFWRAEEEYGRD
ncbi:MAG: ABC transporter permease [Kineosporiaceae bacterium]